MTDYRRFSEHPVSFLDAMNKGMYRAWGVKVTDGDTAVLEIDLGFSNTSTQSIRFEDIDTPETRGTKNEERARALAAKDFTSEMLLNRPLLVKTKFSRSFSRYVGHVYYLNDELEMISIADQLVAEGHEK